MWKSSTNKSFGLHRRVGRSRGDNLSQDSVQHTRWAFTRPVAHRCPDLGYSAIQSGERELYWSSPSHSRLTCAALFPSLQHQTCLSEYSKWLHIHLAFRVCCHFLALSWLQGRTLNTRRRRGVEGEALVLWQRQVIHDISPICGSSCHSANPPLLWSRAGSLLWHHSLDTGSLFCHVAQRSAFLWLSSPC